MLGMLLGFGSELYLWLGTHVPWTWWVAIGTVITFASGYAISLIARPETV
jgi:hypothetical protein